MIKGGGDEAAADEVCAAQEGPEEAREVREEEEDGHAEEEARDVEDLEVAREVVVGGEGLVVEGGPASFSSFFFFLPLPLRSVVNGIEVAFGIYTSGRLRIEAIALLFHNCKSEGIDHSAMHVCLFLVLVGYLPKIHGLL
jgi:hypothetical protein